MFSANANGVAFGVSSAPDRPRHLTLWVDNQTDTSMTFFVCCSAFLLTHIDIYNSADARLANRDVGLDKGVVESCTCSGERTVAPHTNRALHQT